MAQLRIIQIGDKMKKILILLISIWSIIPITMKAQENKVTFNSLRIAYEQYIQYCNTDITDTIIQDGTVNVVDIPIYRKGIIVGYKETVRDTTWSLIKCQKYKNDYSDETYSRYGYVFSVDTCFHPIISKWHWDYPCKKNPVIIVSRDHICHIKLENPSETGFYKWLFNKLKN